MGKFGGIVRMEIRIIVYQLVPIYPPRLLETASRNGWLCRRRCPISVWSNKVAVRSTYLKLTIPGLAGYGYCGVISVISAKFQGKGMVTR